MDLVAVGKTDTVLVAILVDGEVELKVMFEDPNILQADNRNGLIDAGEFWVFEEPEDIDEFDLNELEFASRIEFDDADYEQKALGTLFCPYNGQEDVLAAISEYDLVAGESSNTELMLFEYGHVDDERGGYVTLYFGYTINMSEIDVLKR